MNIHLFNHFLHPDDKAGTDPSSSDGGFKYIHNTDIVIVVGDTWYKSFLWFQNLYGTGRTCGYYTTDWQRYGKYAGEVSINFMHRTCIYTTHWALESYIRTNSAHTFMYVWTLLSVRYSKSTAERKDWTREHGTNSNVMGKAKRSHKIETKEKKKKKLFLWPKPT